MNLLPTLVFSATLLAAIPAFLSLINLRVFRRLRPATRVSTTVSVLIPARNEASHISESLRTVLANRGVELEVIVLDDHSTDRTADLVREWMSTDTRVRLVQAPPLAPGWCGKQHACHVLASRARHDLLVFLDADVRLASDALIRIVAMMEQPEAPALASGFPRQLMESPGEKLLLPLIHFLLMGYLPMHLMQWTRWPAFSAGCGQLFVVRPDAYHRAGGHARIRASLHDGLKLPRVFRQAGLATGLFDASDIASCRMYRSSGETWAGLSKNATEGIAAPGAIGPWTLLLAGGQLLPFLLLAASPWLPPQHGPPILMAVLLAWLPRFLVMKRWHHPFLSVWLHPLAVASLLWLQWSAFFRHLAGKPARWKGRRYPAAAAAVLCFFMGPLSAAPARESLPRIDLPDQFGRPQVVAFPAERVTVISVADRHGRESAAAWTDVLRPYRKQLNLYRIADARGTPGLLKNRIRKRLQNEYKEPLLIDWTGATSATIGGTPGTVTFIIADPGGRILHRSSGPPTPETVTAFIKALEAALDR